MRWLFFIIFSGGGLLLCIYYRKITELIGYRMAWAEKYLGSTYYAYFLFGLIGIILGLLIVTNIIDLGWFGI
jgi:hypothetical protein